ncbi:MAG: hypothetical protein M1376_19070 [Planctomycetes bacterium]|nr:hypothetical protein [Planctomycetota bacterium]
MEAQKQDVARTRPKKKWPWALVGVLIVLLVIVLLIPVFLSSPGFTRWVQAKISRSTGGQAGIRDLSVGWFRGVRIAGFSYRAENGWTEVDVSQITTMPRYASLLSGTLALGRTVLEQPRVAIDLRERPPSAEKKPVDMNELERIRDVVIRDGRVRLTDTHGQTVQLADLNSDLSIRPPGQTSRFKAGAVVLAAQQSPGQLTVVGQATPSQKTGWSLRGTSGELTVDVNDLNLASVAPFLDLAGLQVQARGQVSGHLTSALQDGQIQNINGTVTGQNLDLTGPTLQGDQVRTAQLNATVNLAQAGDVVDVNQLEVRTDWATVSLTGTLPKTPGSLSQLLESGAAYNVRGNFDINLAAVLSQMPHTLGVRPDMQVTNGRATGSINTTTENGRAALTAQAQILGLAGVVNNQKVALSGPIQTALQLSSGKQGAQIDNLTVTAPFAKVSASGTFQQIHYQGQADLAALQTQLGPFINLGSYQLAGQLTSKGQVSLGEKITGITGTLAAQQLVLASDGNSVSEPQMNVTFTAGLDQQQQTLAIQNLTANASFGTLGIQNGIIPMGAGSPAPLSLVLTANNVDLNKLARYDVLLGALPKGLTVAGTAQSQVKVEKKKNVYHLSSTATRIQNLQVISRGEPPFQQPEVTASFDVYADPNQKTINIERLLVESPQIKIQKGQFTRTRQGPTIKAQGALDGQFDWAAVAPLISTLLPGQLSISGQRPVAINFTSVYPAHEPNGLLAHLTSQASLGFDRAAYLGFDFGPTQLDLRSQDGLMTIGPVSTTVNNGRLNFLGNANLRGSPPMLMMPTLVHVAQGIQINEQTAKTLLKYVNPIFADAVEVSGTANFDVEQLAIPLTADMRTRAQMNGRIWIDKMQLGASSLLSQIFSLGGQNIRGQILTLHPTVLVLQKGIVRYDDMQIDIGQNPVNFRGSIGLDGALNMTIVLPYTLEGRLVRVGQAQVADRIAVPLTGTLSKPQLNLQKLLELQFKGQIERGLEQLFKKR